LQGVDARPVKLGLALQVLALLFEVGFGGLNLAGGQVDLGLKVGRVDLEEQVAFLYSFVVSDGNDYDGARDSRCNPDNVSSYLAISGPGILYVSRVQGNRRLDRQANNYCRG